MVLRPAIESLDFYRNSDMYLAELRNTLKMLQFGSPTIDHKAESLILDTTPQAKYVPCTIVVYYPLCHNLKCAISGTLPPHVCEHHNSGHISAITATTSTKGRENKRK